MTVTLWFWILAGLALAYLILGATYVVRHNRDVKSDNLKKADEMASLILEKLNWPSMERWTSNNTIEFVSVILGVFPSKREVWARVWRTKTDLEIRVEYYWDARSEARWWAEAVAKSLKQKGISVEVRESLIQPREDEIYPDKTSPVTT